MTTVSLCYQPHQWLRLFLRRAGNFRFPKADENAVTPMNVHGLKTQTGVSYETGVEILHHNWRSKLSLYKLDLDNEIDFDPTQRSDQPFGANRNLDPTTRIGGMFSLAHAMTQHLWIGGEYSYVHARFREGRFSGKSIPFVAANSASFYSDYLINDFTTFHTELVYTGRRFAAGDDGNTTGKVPGFAIVNLALRFHNNHCFVLFRINNLFNKLYNSYTSYDTISRMSFFYPAPGRNFLLTIGFNLS